MHSVPRASMWTFQQMSARERYMEHAGQEDVRNLKFIRLRGSYSHLQVSDSVWSAKWIPKVPEEYSAFTFSVEGGRTPPRIWWPRMRLSDIAWLTPQHDKTQVFLRPLQFLEIRKKMPVCVRVLRSRGGNSTNADRQACFCAQVTCNGVVGLEVTLRSVIRYGEWSYSCSGCTSIFPTKEARSFMSHENANARAGMNSVVLLLWK